MGIWCSRVYVFFVMSYVRLTMSQCSRLVVVLNIEIVLGLEFGSLGLRGQGRPLSCLVPSRERGVAPARGADSYLPPHSTLAVSH